MAPVAPIRRYRSVFLSDLHLGAPACRAQALLQFLNGIECERLYLLGDVVDGWKLKRRWRWPASHAAILERLLALARAGTEVVYIPGNHDAFARAWCGATAAGIRIEREWVHEAADGRRYLLAHGDAYDPAAERAWATRTVGDLVYRALLRVDYGARRVRRLLRRPHWSLVAAVKARSPPAKQVVAAFQTRLAEEGRRRSLDGVICGHIHTPAEIELDGLRYINCGDWVESLSAAVEHADGALEVLRPACRRRSAPRPLRRSRLPSRWIATVASAWR